MNRTELACYGLLVSAFLLAGMLVVQVQSRGPLAPTAEAAMSITRGDLSVMTARTKDNEEALFVMDNISQELHILTLDMSKKRLERQDTRRLDRLFGTRRTPRSSGRSRSR